MDEEVGRKPRRNHASHKYIVILNLVDKIWIEGIIALIAVFLFQFRNPQRKLLRAISLFIVGIFLSKILLYFSEPFGQSVWVVSSIGLALSYILRFKDKHATGFIDYLKFLGLALLIIYPLTSCYHYYVGDGSLFYLLSGITLPMLTTIYLYDRWILTPEKMKRKFIVVLVLQSFFILLMLAFFLVQKARADEQTQIAVQQAERAIAHEKLCNEFRIQLERCNGKMTDP